MPDEMHLNETGQHVGKVKMNLHEHAIEIIVALFEST